MDARTLPPVVQTGTCFIDMESSDEGSSNGSRTPSECSSNDPGEKDASDFNSSSYSDDDDGSDAEALPCSSSNTNTAGETVQKTAPEQAPENPKKEHAPKEAGKMRNAAIAVVIVLVEYVPRKTKSGLNDGRRGMSVSPPLRRVRSTMKQHNYTIAIQKPRPSKKFQ